MDLKEPCATTMVISIIKCLVFKIVKTIRFYKRFYINQKTNKQIYKNKYYFPHNVNAIEKILKIAI